LLVIGNGWIRAPLARWPIYPLAAAGLVASQVFLVAPAMSAQQTNPDARIGTRVSVNCGGGVYATNRRLPAGFNALTATRAQLIANDLPVRPAGPVRLAAWRKFVTGGVKAIPARCAGIRVLSGSTVGTPGTPPPTGGAEPSMIIGDVKPDMIIGDAKPSMIIGDAKPRMIIGDAKPSMIIGDAKPNMIIGDATAAGTAGSAGSGATATQTAGTDVSGTWRVPAAGKHATAGPNGIAAAGLALGLGTSTAHPMVQAASAASRAASGRVSYYLWWRVVPQQASPRQISVRVHAGDSVYAHIGISHGVATVSLRDLSTGAGGTYLLHLAQLSHA
jgi:hypothetical protein